APAVVTHGHVAEVRPAGPADVDRGAQVDVVRGQRGAHRLPPGQEVGLPRLEGPLQAPVLAQADVVRDLLVVVGWGRHRSDSLPVEVRALPGAEPAQRAI